MNDMEGRRLSESMSSSSDEESPSFERPSFSTSQHRGFNNGGKKRQHDDSGLELDVFDKPAKKMALEADFDAAEKAQRMMEKMGYKKGVGLGKHEQGRLEPVEASQQKGRRGLGHYNEKLKEANLRWDPSEEVITIKEEINWLTNTKEPPNIKDLNDWMGIGPTKRTIEDETLFCDAGVVSGVVGSKSVFDNLDKNEMRRARTRSNPFETIRGSIFLNRAAVKMANMDKACNFMFTKSKTEPGELLYFADVCAGPGGFSEYVLYRKKWHAKGFGFTLRESNDFKLEDFYAGSPDTFHPFYGPKGDGDVYNPENQEAFRQLIMQQTHGKGVHFMMSDGGFSVEGEESVQEILSKQLYLCQCLVALMIVREKGHFVTKVFDLFTPFSAGLVYIMSRCFDSITIFKPNTSRPANSERYLICKGKHPNVQDVIEYFSRANRVLLNQDKSRNVMQLVPYEIIEEDQEFFKYLKNSNEVLGRKQIVGLLKIAAYCEDTTLMEERQAEMRKMCLDHWSLPDTSRTIPRMSGPEERLKTIMKSSNMKFMTTKPKIIMTSTDVNNILKAHLDWFCMLCSSSSQIDDKSATFYVGMGRSKSYRYNDGTWIRVPNLHLSPDTLVYAELVPELRGEYTRQRRTNALHILDSYWLGGENVSQKYIEERYELTKLYAEALWKPTNGEWIRVRAKELHRLTENLEEKLNLKFRTLKKGDKALTHVPSRDTTHYDDIDDPYFIVPKSVLFLKSTAHNWSRHISRTSGYPYYFNCANKTTVYNKEKPPEADASFVESFENRMVWFWPPDPTLTRDSFFEMLRNKYVRPVTA